jgi:type II secretory pathway pseudopilin PulG
MKLQNSHISRPEGFTLVITVVIVALLTIMAVAFLFTSGLDRTTARASVNKAKADLAAQTAVNTAAVRLTDNISNYPDSATTWEIINGDPSTVLYYRDETPEHAIASNTPAKLYALPLVSGAIAQLNASKNTTLPATLDDNNSIDINHARFSGDTQGWVGAAPGVARLALRGPWVNLTDSDNKVTGRYAYWMEDESFKANVNLMGKTLRGSGTLGNSPDQIPLQGWLKASLNTSPDLDIAANDIFSMRAGFKNSLLLEARELNRTTGQPTLADSSKFEATIFSGALNLSRGGSKRVNLNKLVVDSTTATEIRNQLDKIIKTVSYHLPNFPQRFYRNGSDKNTLDVSSSGSPSNQVIYLNKIAANIRDYIDTDSAPTVVNNDLSVNIGAVPAHSLPGGGASGTNEVIAIGKEAVPVIQEYMVRVKQIEPKLRQVATCNYNIEIDHYVEVWNMTNKDITLASLGSNPFLRISNQFGWTSYGGTDIPADPSRDFSIPLSSFTNSTGASLVFPAGGVTVLTTDPVPLPSTLLGVDPAKVFRPPAGTPANSYRVYTGTCNRKTVSGHPHLDAQTRPVTSPNAADYETEIILGNDSGVLESFGAPAVYYITVNADDGTLTRNTVRIDQTEYYFRASSLKGNNPSFGPTISQTGDPRTNNEQLNLSSLSAVNDDQTGYKTELNSDSVPSPSNNDASLTTLNSTYVDPSLWTDPSDKTTADATHAPSVVANGPLTSIGQLGEIFDPPRSMGPLPKGSGDIRYSRGGGRTFKIGQPELYDATNKNPDGSFVNPNGLWDGDSNSASREWAAWRLTDVFSTLDLVQLDGRININGVSRDNGIALKAALYGYNFQPTPDSDSNLAGNAFDADPTAAGDKINVLISQIQARLKNDPTAYNKAFATSSGPFAERGEVSEMPMFNTGKDLVSSVDTASVYDRGREELFRRLVELTTTRGNIFTVYAVGQSLIPQAGTAPPIVTSTSQLKVTFRIDPVWNAGTPADPNWDPTTTTRFQKPDRYAIKILYAGD